MENWASSHTSILLHPSSLAWVWPRFCSCWWDPCLAESWPPSPATAGVSEISLDPRYRWSRPSVASFCEHNVWMNRSSWSLTVYPEVYLLIKVRNGVVCFLKVCINCYCVSLMEIIILKRMLFKAFLTSFLVFFIFVIFRVRSILYFTIV